MESEEGEVPLAWRAEAGDIQAVEIRAKAGVALLNGVAHSAGLAVPMEVWRTVAGDFQPNAVEFLVEFLPVTISLSLGVLPKMGHGVEEFCQEHGWLHWVAFCEIEA